jgi:hypothetical protein
LQAFGASFGGRAAAIPGPVPQRIHSTGHIGSSREGLAGFGWGDGGLTHDAL